MHGTREDREAPNVFTKLLILIVLATGIGAALLGLRQQQLEIAHEATFLHRQINHARHSLWAWQSRIAEQLEPQHLRGVLDRMPLELEPVTADATDHAEPIARAPVQTEFIP